MLLICQLIRWLCTRYHFAGTRLSPSVSLHTAAQQWSPLLDDAEVQPLLLLLCWVLVYSAEISSLENIFQSRPNLHLLNLPYISLARYQYNFQTILHCSWVIKRRELNTFSAFSPLRARLKSSCAACLPHSAIRRSGRPGESGREEGEVGWSIIARSERNLCVWSGALCMSACQPGDFSSCVWKHACSFLHTLFRESVGVWQTLLNGKLAFMALCVSN